MLLGNTTELMNFDKINKATVYKDDKQQVLLLNLPAGAEMKPHISPVDAFVVVEKGEVEFVLEGELFLLSKGDLFRFKAHQVHSLKALSDFSMLIVK